MTTEKEYVVISKKGIDVETIDDDLGIVTTKPNIPNRAVKIANPRLGSKRMTHWYLTEDEVKILRNDPRIESVEIHPEHNPYIKFERFASQAGNFHRYNVDSHVNTSVNWGLKRINEIANTYNGSTTIAGDFLYSLDGSGVDVIIQDSGIQADHPEWEDSNGTTRLQQIDWYAESGITEIVLDTSATFRYSNNPTQIHNATAQYVTNKQIFIGDIVYVTSGTYAGNQYPVTSITDTTITVSSGDFSTTTIETFQVLRNAIKADFYSDTNGHGTHVAGIAAGKTYGWAKNAHIYSQKLTTLAGTSDLNPGVSTVAAFDMIRLWHNNKNNGRPTVVNMSWGSSYSLPVANLKGGNYRGTDWLWGTDYTNQTTLWEEKGVVESYNGYFNIPAYDATLRVEVEEMIDDGIHVVIAAGNSSYKADDLGGLDYDNYVTFTFEADYNFYYHRQGSPDSPQAFNVGNLDSRQWDVDGGFYQDGTGGTNNILDVRAYSSVNGPAIDVWAPGTNITSACSTISEMPELTYPLNNSFKITTITGTSMAAPQVAGVCALYLQSEPSLTPSQLKNKILNDSKTGVVVDNIVGDYRHPASMNDGDGKTLFSRYGQLQSWNITKS